MSVFVKDHSKLVKENIHKENALGRIAGPFNNEPLAYLRWVVAKKDWGYRLDMAAEQGRGAILGKMVRPPVTWF